MHTNVYACGCTLSVTCQVTMVNPERSSSSSDYIGTLRFQCHVVLLRMIAHIFSVSKKLTSIGNGRAHY